MLLLRASLALWCHRIGPRLVASIGAHIATPGETACLACAYIRALKAPVLCLVGPRATCMEEVGPYTGLMPGTYMPIGKETAAGNHQEGTTSWMMHTSAHRTHAYFP